MSKITDALRRAEAEGAVIRSAYFARPEAAFVPERVISGFSTTPAAYSPPSPKAQAEEENSGSLKSWEQAIAQVTKQLERCDEQIAAQAGEQSQLQSRMQAAEALAAKVERERAEIRKAQEQAAEKAASLEKSRMLWARQLEALRECAVISQACRDAEKELKANAESVDRAIALQKRAAEEREHYEQQEIVLRGKVEALRFKLAGALASTGTTDAHQGAA